MPNRLGISRHKQTHSKVCASECDALRECVRKRPAVHSEDNAGQQVGSAKQRRVHLIPAAADGSDEGAVQQRLDRDVAQEARGEERLELQIPGYRSRRDHEPQDAKDVGLPAIQRGLDPAKAAKSRLIELGRQRHGLMVAERHRNQGADPSVATGRHRAHPRADGSICLNSSRSGGSANAAPRQQPRRPRRHAGARHSGLNPSA